MNKCFEYEGQHRFNIGSYYNTLTTISFLPMEADIKIKNRIESNREENPLSRGGGYEAAGLRTSSGLADKSFNINL